MVKSASKYVVPEDRNRRTRTIRSSSRFFVAFLSVLNYQISDAFTTRDSAEVDCIRILQIVTKLWAIDHVSACFVHIVCAFDHRSLRVKHNCMHSFFLWYTYWFVTTNQSSYIFLISHSWFNLTSSSSSHFWLPTIGCLFFPLIRFSILDAIMIVYWS